MKTIEDLELENINEQEYYMVLFVGKDGIPYWVLSEKITEKQEESFLRVNAVLNNPSLVLLLCLRIETFFLYVLYRLNMIFKFKNK
jgi:hypothetical protein